MGIQKGHKTQIQGQFAIGWTPTILSTRKMIPMQVRHPMPPDFELDSLIFLSPLVFVNSIREAVLCPFTPSDVHDIIKLCDSVLEQPLLHLR